VCSPVGPWAPRSSTCENNGWRRGNRSRRNRIIKRRKRVNFALFRCTSAELSFSCCDSVAAAARPGHHNQVPAKNNERRRGHRPRDHGRVLATHNGRRRRQGHRAQLVPAWLRGQRPGETMKYLRRTTCAAAGSGLGTTVNEHSPAMHNKRRRGQRPGHHDQVPATHSERRCGQRLGNHDQVPARCRGHRPGPMYLQRKTSAAANRSLGTTIKYLVSQSAGAGNNWAKAYIHKSWARIQINPPVV
jgi:hypothetical protein